MSAQVNYWLQKLEFYPVVEEFLSSAEPKARGVVPVLPSDVKELSKICHHRWHNGAAEGLEFIRGTLKPFNPTKPFAFIKRDDGKEDVFVLLRDVPRKYAHEGARLEFVLERSFDQKKNREATKASKVRCFSE